MIDSSKPEHRYWIGYLLADGCVQHRKPGKGRRKTYATISIDITRKDASHLDLIQKEFGGTVHHLADRVNNTGVVRRSRWGVYSWDLANDLAEFGVVPRKSTRETVPESLALDPDFWRGMVDGDGCLRMRDGRPVIMLGATQSVCESMNALVGTLGIDPVTISKTSGNLKQMGWTGKKATTVIRHLYGRPGPVLARKREAIASVL